jgi:hypothetical protein
MSDVIGIGHNKAPLKELLADAYNYLNQEVDALLGSPVAIGLPITSDKEAADAADFVKAAKAIETKSEAAREQEKKPFLDAGRDVDAFFKNVIAPVSDAKSGASKRMTVYLDAKVKAERAAQAEAERIARDEAARKLAEAEAQQGTAKGDDALDAAVRLENYADQAAKVVAMRPSELAKTTTASGVTATLKTEWAFEIEDAKRIPLETLRPYIDTAAIEKAVRAAVKIGARDIPGVRIFEQSKAMVR